MAKEKEKNQKSCKHGRFIIYFINSKFYAYGKD